MTVAAILDGKGSELVSVAPDTPIGDAVKLLHGRNIGAVPVIRAGRLEGMFSERDVIRVIAERGVEAIEGRVSDAMTAPAITTELNHPVLTALSVMTRQRVRHLPVIDGGAVIGIVSIGDLVKHRIDRIESDAAAMRDYIQSA